MTRITSHIQLKQRIAELSAEGKRRENLILAEVRAVSDIIHHPGDIVKTAISGLAGDRDVRSDLMKIGVGIASNLVSSRLSSSASGISSLVSLLLSGLGGRGSSGLLKLTGILGNLFNRKKS